MLFARAKRGRVVQNEYEKANRRPTRPTDTARHPKKQVRNLTRRCQKTGFKIVHLHFSNAPDLSSDRPFLVQKCKATRFRGSGLKFRSAIFDAKMRVRSSSLAFNSVIFDAKMRVRSSYLAFRSAVFDASLRFRSSSISCFHIGRF